MAYLVDSSEFEKFNDSFNNMNKEQTENDSAIAAALQVRS